MKQIVINLTFSKSTKNTHVYITEDAAIPQLYIKKDALPSTPPNEVKITIEHAE